MFRDCKGIEHSGIYSYFGAVCNILKCAIITCSLKSRWQQHINPDVSKFEGYYQTIVKLNQSGKTHEDHVREAMDLFLNAACNTTKKKFLYSQAWERLRRHPKWGGSMQTTPSKKRKHNDIDNNLDGASGEEGEESQQSESCRPRGKKYVKERFYKDHAVRQIEYTAKLAEAAEKKASALAHLNQIQCAKLFTLSAGASFEECQEFNDLLRQKTLYAMRKGNLLRHA